MINSDSHPSSLEKRLEQISNLINNLVEKNQILREKITELTQKEQMLQAQIEKLNLDLQTKDDFITSVENKVSSLIEKIEPNQEQKFL